MPDSLASGAVVDLGQWRATGFQQASSALAQYAAGGCVYHRSAAVVKAVDGMASCACSLSIPGLFHRHRFSGRDAPASAMWRYVAAEEGSMRVGGRSCRLLLIQDATERGACWCGAGRGSLDLK